MKPLNYEVKKFILLAVFLLQWMFAPPALATHLRAADIQVERICGTLTFRIAVIAYLNSSSSTRFGTNSEVLFGDGASVRIPLTSSTPRPDLGTNISVATFTTEHTYAANGTYSIAYIERDRSAGVLNIANSTDVPYVTFVKINTDPTFGCNKYPVLAVVPLDRACSGAAFYHNSGAFDTDGDSLSYQMSTPSASPTAFAIYDEPNAKKFYPNANIGNEERNGAATFTINSLTGLVTWNAPGAIGEYNIAFKIIEWRKKNGVYVEASSTTRDMQIVVESCTNKRPSLVVPADRCVVAGTSIEEVILGMDPENHQVKIEVFSELLQAPDSLAAIVPKRSDFVASSPPAQLSFSWATTCDDIRQQPYQVVFKITDRPPDGPKLVSFVTWSIRVVAPEPVIETTVLDVVRLHGVLNWQPYSCNNVKQIQIFRKVDSYPFTPGTCQLGIPGFLGYQLIDQIQGSETSYRDTNFELGLSPGATYCYRLVALVDDTKSIVSNELCIGPIQTDAPVITHVTVEKTHENGSIRVSWRSPADINRIQFPKPYQYEVFRARDFVGDEQLSSVGRVSDTTFVDTGIDSKNKVFNYRVVVYAKPQFSSDFIPVDTSAVASSVWLSAVGNETSIALQWRDSVPWSNVVRERPYHLIYRSEGVKQGNPMMLLDSVLVTVGGFNYVDTRVRKNQIYSYKVQTRGTYGNEAIPLQENFSQIVFVTPANDLTPCPPTLEVAVTDCASYLAQYTCRTTSFANNLSWIASATDDCRLDIVAYRIYAADFPDGSPELIATVDATEFSDANLSSFARCYQVSAVDSRGTESPLSEMVCNDNCPYFQLPNVFTPNGDGCNDVFASDIDPLSIGESSPCQATDLTQCSRFVKSVSITIYDRWGKQTFQGTTSASTINHVLWNGRDQHGNSCASGVYYYLADVTFITTDNAKRNRRYKGWVHLLR
ncbi:MAG TPA: gliding motility-associated C-terminal domain-containing protein [Chryseosolibacter sp.]